MKGDKGGQKPQSLCAFNAFKGFVDTEMRLEESEADKLSYRIKFPLFLTEESLSRETQTKNLVLNKP